MRHARSMRLQELFRQTAPLRRQWIGQGAGSGRQAAIGGSVRSQMERGTSLLHKGPGRSNNLRDAPRVMTRNQLTNTFTRSPPSKTSFRLQIRSFHHVRRAKTTSTTYSVPLRAHPTNRYLLMSQKPWKRAARPSLPSWIS